MLMELFSHDILLTKMFNFIVNLIFKIQIKEIRAA